MALRPLYIAVLVLVAHLSLSEAAVRVWGLRASGLTGDPTGPPDPYVKVWCGSSFGGMTEFHKDNANPSWSAEFYFSNCKANDVLKLEVWDKDLNFDDHLGTCTSQLCDFLESHYLDEQVEMIKNLDNYITNLTKMDAGNNRMAEYLFEKHTLKSKS